MSKRLSLKKEMDDELERLKIEMAMAKAMAGRTYYETKAATERMGKSLTATVAEQSAAIATPYTGPTYTVPWADVPTEEQKAEDRRLLCRLIGEIEDLEAIEEMLKEALVKAGKPLSASLVETTLAGMRKTVDQVAARLKTESVSAKLNTGTLSGDGMSVSSAGGKAYVIGAGDSLSWYTSVDDDGRVSFTKA